MVAVRTPVPILQTQDYTSYCVDLLLLSSNYQLASSIIICTVETPIIWTPLGAEASVLINGKSGVKTYSYLQSVPK